MQDLIFLQCEGLPGPTHHFGGLACGDLASTQHAGQISHPKQAALQGLEKMKCLHGLGVPIVIYPPHERPWFPLLRNLGFSGSPEQILSQTQKFSPKLLSACFSSSFMWLANSATVSGGFQTHDHKIHITPANLMNQFHRSIEAETNVKFFNQIFSNKKYFTVHQPLHAHASLGDEGAANHHLVYLGTQNFGDIFVYGKKTHLSQTKLIQDFKQKQQPKRYPARATYEASCSIARKHQLDFSRVLFLQQAPELIDRGVFHNDLVGVGCENIYIYHENAYIQAPGEENISEFFARLAVSKTQAKFYLMPISEKQLSLKTAIQTYFFNSEIISSHQDPKQKILICPKNCELNSQVQRVIQTILAGDNPIQHVYYIDLSESLANGGGPACLRLRMPISQAAFESIDKNILFSVEKYELLKTWINQYYPEQLSVQDLLDPQCITNSFEALDQLSQILKLGSIYEFQNNTTQSEFEFKF